METGKRGLNVYQSSILQHILSLGAVDFLTAVQAIPQFAILAFDVFLARIVKVRRKSAYASTVLRVGLKETILLALFSAVIILFYRL